MPLKWSKIDPDAKPNSVLTASGIQAWADADDLKTSFQPQSAATICELNQTILDGGQTAFPSDPSAVSWGFFSSALSSQSGAFQIPPVLDVSFSQNASPVQVSSAGITLYFCDSYPTSISVAWYSGAALLTSGTFVPDGLTYFVPRAVHNYTRVVLTFLAALPYRYIKLWKIEYGQIKILKDSELMSYSITENVNECSTQIVVNTAKLDLFAAGEYFDLVTNAGEYDLIKTRQPVEDTDGYGTFYISKMEAENSSISMDLVDLLGVIGDIKFYGGMYHTTLSAFIAELAAAAGTSTIFSSAHNGFQVDSTVASRPVVGYVPAKTIRDALQMVCIACRVVADTSRSDKIRLRAKDTTKTADLSDSEIVQGDKTSINAFYTGVTVTAYTYKQESASKQIFKTQYATGIYTVEFSNPYASVTLSGATITAVGINYVTFTVSSATTVTATGYAFVETETQYTARVADAAGSVESVKKLEKNTLVNPDNAASVAQNYLDYYTHKYKSEYTTLEPCVTGKMYQANHVTGILEKQTIDRITDLSKAVLYGDYQPGNG